MNIREVKTEDLDLVSVLFNEYRVFYKKESDLDGVKIFLSDRLSKHDSKIFVCEYEQNKLVGFMQLYPLFSSTKMKKLWLLNDLFVAPSHRGKGISLLLIEKAKELVNETNACGMLLETDISNTIGNSLYPRAGFVLKQESNFYEWNR